MMIDKYDVVLKVEKLEREERRICEEYCRLNPADRERRERDRDMVLFAYSRVLSARS